MTESLTPDAGIRSFGDGTTIVGGDPPRVLRLTPAGAAVAHELLIGAAIDSPARPTSAARLITAGLAHPRVRRPTAAAHDVTVVIPVRDRSAQLARCLHALEGVPVLVVDDGSADPAAVTAACAASGAQLVRRPVSGGRAAARNAALARIETGLIAFLDSDCVPEPGWLESLYSLFTDPALGAAAPRIRPLRLAGDGPVARYAAARSPLDMEPLPARVRPGGRVGYLPTAALLIRRETLGAFDVALRFGEDVDLIWRILDAGWTVRYEPAAVVHHAEPSRWSELARRRFDSGAPRVRWPAVIRITSPRCASLRDRRWRSPLPPRGGQASRPARSRSTSPSPRAG